MRGKKIELSASEMMEMRREGLFNKDIAELLEISLPVVYRHIGKQGGRMERLAAFAKKEKKKDEPAKVDETKEQIKTPRYIPVEEVYSVGGISITSSNIVRCLSISAGEGMVTLSYEQAAELVAFLAWLGTEKSARFGDGNGQNDID